MLPMTKQLRMYTVKPDEMDAWCEEWRAKVVPLRRQHGFEVVGAWVIEDTNQFVWVIEHDGPEEWNVADARYYESPERKGLKPDPARHLEKTPHWFVRDP
jgi:hypothetical protein